VLPSGKVVDQSTIDKHAEEEAKWGRQPSDPFTGLEYNAQRKAILNLALKARIEKFLMEHSEHFKAVPRSLGTSRLRRRHASQFASSTCQPGQISPAAGTYSALSNAYKQQQRKSRATPRPPPHQRLPPEDRRTLRRRPRGPGTVIMAAAPVPPLPRPQPPSTRPFSRRCRRSHASASWPRTLAPDPD